MTSPLVRSHGAAAEMEKGRRASEEVDAQRRHLMTTLLSAPTLTVLLEVRNEALTELEGSLRGRRAGRAGGLLTACDPRTLAGGAEAQGPRRRHVEVVWVV